MTKLSDTQFVILGVAAQRADLSVLPLPDTLKLKGGALTKVMESLLNRGLIRVIGGDGGPERTVLTSGGLAAIGVEQEGDESAAAAGRNAAPNFYSTQGAPIGQGKGDTGHDGSARDEETDAPSAVTPMASTDGDAPPADAQLSSTGADGSPKSAKRPASGKGKAAKALKGGKPTPRAGTKQALMIDMLKRPGGATVEEIAAATGWQHHTVRGAISGTLKKKLGLIVEATRPREVEPNRTGAKGGSTVYRITG